MLVNIKGKSLIRYVYSKCLKSKFFKDVVVATCDKKIFREIVDNKGKAVMTSNSHKGCVSRIAEAVLKIKRIKINDYICIVQGDEVLVDFHLLNSLCLFIKKKNNKYDIVNVVSKIKNNKEYKSQSVIKALVGENDYIFNMLRKNNLHEEKFFNQNISKRIFRQTGIIILKKKYLLEYSKLKRSFFEIKESIDMLRFIENDYKIKSFPIKKTMIGIDTKKDYTNYLKNYK